MRAPLSPSGQSTQQETHQGEHKGDLNEIDERRPHSQQSPFNDGRRSKEGPGNHAAELKGTSALDQPPPRGASEDADEKAGENESSEASHGIALGRRGFREGDL